MCGRGASKPRGAPPISASTSSTSASSWSCRRCFSRRCSSSSVSSSASVKWACCGRSGSVPDRSGGCSSAKRCSCLSPAARSASLARSRYASLIMFGLRTWWVDAVGTTALTLHVTPASLIAGAVGGVVAAVVCIWWTLRALGRVSERSLLAGDIADQRMRDRVGGLKTRRSAGEVARRRDLVARACSGWCCCWWLAALDGSRARGRSLAPASRCSSHRCVCSARAAAARPERARPGMAGSLYRAWIPQRALSSRPQRAVDGGDCVGHVHPDLGRCLSTRRAGERPGTALRRGRLRRLRRHAAAHRRATPTAEADASH